MHRKGENMDSALSVIRQCSRHFDRSLSIIDLIEQGTFSLTQAIWLAARISEGYSWLVGAQPGGAGKTTIMCALLALLPDIERAVLARSGDRWETFGHNDCVVTEEISDHQRGHYIWGEDVRGLTRIPSRGGRITSTIHADTLDQARQQVAIRCGAGEEGLTAFGLFIPIKVTFLSPQLEKPSNPAYNHPARHRPFPPPGRFPPPERFHGPVLRKVQNIYQYNSTWEPVDREVPLTPQEEEIGVLFRKCLVAGIRTSDEFRAAWLTQS
jgi:hypothetical protein